MLFLASFPDFRTANTKNAHDAQDLTQDTFIRIWDKAGQYTGKGAPMGWILSIARNEALQKLRRESRMQNMDEQEWAAIPDNAQNISVEDRILLQSSLAILGDQERRVVILHSISGLKHHEIAALLELPLPTVLSKYNRALKKMKAHMEGGNNR